MKSLFNKDYILNIFMALFFILGAALITYVLFSNNQRLYKSEKIGDLSCVEHTFALPQLDEHMKGFLKENQYAKVYNRFYHCNEVQRNDLVYYQVAQGIDPVIRIVKGLPGDEFALEQDKQNRSHWFLSINGKRIKRGNSDYFISSDTIPALRTYQISRSPKLAKDEYIIISYNPPGLSDSGNMGLIHKKSFLGRAVIIDK